MSDKALISIGLPTYNRAATLGRAIQSVLAQDYSDFELIISDNASTDETAALCEEFQRQDPRIRYLRQTVNRGPVANFQAALDQAGGEFFMWLADDDWLAPDYVSRCVRVLLDDPACAIACGLVKHCNADGTVLYDGDRINLPQSSGRERVLEYLRLIRHDGTFYAVMRRGQLLREPLRNTLASDWLLILPIVFTGTVRMLFDTYLYRTDGGDSATMESVVRSVGMPRLYAKSLNLFYLTIAKSIFFQILIVSPAFRSIGIFERFSLACAASLIIKRRFAQFRPHPLRRFLVWTRGKISLRTRLKRILKRGKKDKEGIASGKSSREIIERIGPN